MLKVTLHSGGLAKRNAANELAALDIAYAKKEVLSNYAVALSMRGTGEVAPAALIGYPRWSGSVWDLVGRSLAQALYRTDAFPSAGPADRRCAYATRICASIEQNTGTERGLEIGTVEIAQQGKRRGLYLAIFEEDILGERSVEFEFGCKALNPAELLLRAICWALFGKDTLGPKPTLIVPTPICLEGVDRFYLDALTEPARTGFKRFLAASSVSEAPELPVAADYVRFLMS